MNIILILTKITVNNHTEHAKTKKVPEKCDFLEEIELAYFLDKGGVQGPRQRKAQVKFRREKDILTL